MFISTILSPTRAEMTQSEAAYPKHLSGIPQRIKVFYLLPCEGVDHCEIPIFNATDCIPTEAEI